MAQTSSTKPFRKLESKTIIYICLLFLSAIVIYSYPYPFKNLRDTKIQETPAEDSFDFKQLSYDLEFFDKIENAAVDTSTSSTNSTQITTLLKQAKTKVTELSKILNVLLNRSISIHTRTVPAASTFAQIEFRQNDIDASREDISEKPVETITSALNKTHEDVFSTATKESSTVQAENDVFTSSESIERNFLVYSENCRIPNIDPMHPSIRNLVEYSKPLNCTEEIPFTSTKGNTLLLDLSAAISKNISYYVCCYNPFNRDKDGESDNKVKYDDCIPFASPTIINHEFIRVQCMLLNGTKIYEEFHSFIHDKPAVEERCSNVTEQPRYSVLMIGVDSVSRLNMHRQLNKTADYLLNKMGAYEMYGFNKVGDNTFPNLMPIMTGYDERELINVCWNESAKESLDECNFVWNQFASSGYRTLYAEDTPQIASFNYLKAGFYYQPTDYYFRAFMREYEYNLGRNKKLNCHECVGSVSETEAVLHWAEEFANNFSNRSYFAFLWINSLTHDYLNGGSAGDHMYEGFLRRLHQSGALDRTIVILMGDHGMRYGKIRQTFVGRLEERLPMLVISLPPMFKEEYPSEALNMKTNRNRLVTPFDLHSTLQHFLSINNSDWSLRNLHGVDVNMFKNFTSRTYSLFRPIPVDRSCDDAFIDEHWCTCEASLPMDANNANVKRVAVFIVEQLNIVLRKVADKCSSLDLDSITDSRILAPVLEHAGHSADDDIYTVVVKTKPGNAIFEATVRISADDECKLLGSVSRLNLYGNQSSCVDDPILRKYCYCS